MNTYGRVRARDLDGIVMQAKEHLERVGAQPDLRLVQYVANRFIIERIMGDDWSERNLYPPNGRYLRFEFDYDEEGLYRYEHKITSLAGVLYDVQGLDHVEDRLSRLDGVDIEPTLAELSVVSILRSSGTPTFLRPESEGGYEADLVLDDGAPATLEVKCKIETTAELTEGGLLTRLKKARDQVPDDRPAMVWLRLQAHWMHTQAAADLLTKTVQSFLRNTGRISAVIPFYEWAVPGWALPVAELSESNPSLTGHVTRQILFENPRARHSPESFWRVFYRLARLPDRPTMLLDAVSRAMAGA